MAYRNVEHLRSHLSVFEPTYPIQKGYIAWLLLDHAVIEVMRIVKDIVEMAEPDKIINEGTLISNLMHFKKLFKSMKKNLTKAWQSIIRLFLEYFPVTFRRFPSLPAHSTHITPITPPSSSSSEVSNFPELRCTPVSETPYQIDTPHIPTQVQTLTTFIASGSAPCELSPRKLKGDCASCVSKQRTNLHMMQENKKLQKQLRELKKTVRVGCSPLKRFNEIVKSKDDSIRIWKGRYAVLKKECMNTQKLKESLNVSQQQMEIFKRHNDELQEEKRNVSFIIEQQNRILKKLEEDYASLKCKYVKLHRESNSVKNIMHVTVKDLINKVAQLENQVVMLTHGRDVVLQKNDENTKDR